MGVSRKFPKRGHISLNYIISSRKGANSHSFLRLQWSKYEYFVSFNGRDKKIQGATVISCPSLPTSMLTRFSIRSRLLSAVAKIITYGTQVLLITLNATNLDRVRTRISKKKSRSFPGFFKDVVTFFQGYWICEPAWFKVHADMHVKILPFSRGTWTIKLSAVQV